MPNVARNRCCRGVEGKQNMARMLDRLREQPPTRSPGWPVTSLRGSAQTKELARPASRGRPTAAARNFLIFQLESRPASLCGPAARSRRPRFTWKPAQRRAVQT